jgi:hypothetical protein
MGSSPTAPLAPIVCAARVCAPVGWPPGVLGCGEPSHARHRGRTKPAGAQLAWATHARFNPIDWAGQVGGLVGHSEEKGGESVVAIPRFLGGCPHQCQLWIGRFGPDGKI